MLQRWSRIIGVSTVTAAHLLGAPGSSMAKGGGGGHGGGGYGGGGHGSGGSVGTYHGSPSTSFSGSSISHGVGPGNVYHGVPQNAYWHGNPGHNDHDFDDFHRHHEFYGVYPGFYGFGGYPWYSGGLYDPYYARRYNDYPAGYQSFYTPPTPEGISTTPELPSLDPNAALLGVVVPADAEVWFEGKKLAQTGPFREFVSPPLKPGEDYAYTIRARWTADGQVVDQTREVPVRSGDRLMINFRASAAPQPTGGSQP